WSMTVYDADALFNLNVHGNVGGLAQLPNYPNSTMSDIANFAQLLSKSNQGLTPAEVNPGMGFNTDPSVSGTYSGSLTQYQYEFGVAPSASWGQGANMDLYRILTGTANFQSATLFSDLFPGRWGEANTVLYSGLTQGIANGSASATYVFQRPFPG